MNPHFHRWASLSSRIYFPLFSYYSISYIIIFIIISSRIYIYFWLPPQSFPLLFMNTFCVIFFCIIQHYRIELHEHQRKQWEGRKRKYENIHRLIYTCTLCGNESKFLDECLQLSEIHIWMCFYGTFSISMNCYRYFMIFITA